MGLLGTIALVTGGASGLGQAVVQALSEKGTKVAIIDTNEAAAQSLARDFNGIAVSCNVADSNSVIKAFQTLKDNFGIPRICINCAGIVAAERVVGRQGPLPLEHFQHVIDVNLVGTFNVLRIAAAEMMQLSPIEEERGIIINTASVAAFEGQIGQAAYSASKGGVVAMTLPIARELASFQIRVMAIAPGIFETPMMKKLPEKAIDSLVASTIFPKRMGKPQEFANCVLQIIENPMLNGSVIRLDGAIRLA